MFERFTEAARTAVVTAQEQATRTSADHIGAEHVLYGVLADTDGVPAQVLGRLGVDLDVVAGQLTGLRSLDAEALGSLGIDLNEVRRQAEATFGPGALDRSRRQRSGLFGHRTTGGHVPFTREAKASLEGSLRAALAEGHRSLTTAHLLLGLLATEEGTVPRLLERCGVTASPAELRRLVLVELNRAA